MQQWNRLHNGRSETVLKAPERRAGSYRGSGAGAMADLPATVIKREWGAVLKARREIVPDLHPGPRQIITQGKEKIKTCQD